MWRRRQRWDLAWGGGNQMTALNVAIILVTLTVFMIGTKKKEQIKLFSIPFGSFFLGFLLSIAAPGNWVRSSGTAGMGAFRSIQMSFYYCLNYVLKEWTGWPVLLLVILLIPLFWHMAGKTEFRFRYPVLAVFFGFCLVSAMITPPLFAVGNIEAGRLQALIFFMYILVLTLCVGYVAGWARKQWEKGDCPTNGDRLQREQEDGFSKNTAYCFGICILFFLGASGLSVIPDSHYYAFTSAITDLRNGSAEEYAEALSRRAKLYNSDAEGILEVEPLPTQPALLYFSDITPDADSWENKALARYYQKEGVVVRTGD